MTILLSKKDYDWNKTEIDACLRGEMCKITRIKDTESGEITYAICADVTEGGWTTPGGRRFHGHSVEETCTLDNLGTFYLIRATETGDGGCLLEFTDDLNPDLP